MKSSGIKSFARLAAAFGACIVWVSPSLAQITGAITGMVVDPTASAVPQARVVVRNLGTSLERITETDSQGRYVVDVLPVGQYQVEVSASGFKTAVRGPLQLNVAVRLAVDFRLEVGQMTESISVTGEAPLVKTETGEVSYLVNTKQITELSINNRNFLSFQQLIPGASRLTGDEQGIGLTGGKGFAINGLRDDYTGLMIDGVQNTDMGNQSTQMTYPGLETLSEVKILSANYSAEYGTASGANMLVVTRSGTQQFRGAVYEYLRNDKLDARNFFATTRPPLRLNNFGYRIGGPVLLPGYNKDRSKTFFFFAQEWRRRRQAQIIRAATPTEAMRAGDFSEEAARIGRPLLDPTTGQPFPGNRIPASRIDNNARLLLGHAFPLPNTGGFLNFQQNFSVPEDWRQELIRLDHNFTDRTRVMFRFINESWFQGQPTTLWAAQAFPTISSTLDVPAKNLVGKFTKIVSPTVLTEVSINYAHNYGAREKNAVNLRGNFAPPPGLVMRKLFPLPPGRPEKIPDLVFTAGWGSISSSYYPWWAKHDITTVNSLTSKHLGSHTLKFGGEYQFSRTPVQSQTNPSLQGRYDFTGTLSNHPHGDFLTGHPAQYGELDVYREPRYDYHQLELFIQDDWKASSRLTFNLGVRYFYIPHVYEKDDSLTVFRAERWDPRRAPRVLPDVTLAPGSGDLLNGVVGVADGLPRGLVNNYPWQFAPRFGFAYDLTGRQKLVLRGGYGVGFFRVEGNDIYGLVGNPPFANIATVFNPPFGDPARGTIGAERPKNLVTLDPIYRLPYAQTYSFGIQTQLAAQAVLNLSYVGSRGVHLDRGRQLNYPLPSGGTDFDPRLNTRTVPIELIAPFQGWSAITQRETTGNSTYHSLQIEFNRRYANGLQFQAVYTYSKAISDSDGFGALPQNPYNLRAERSLAGFDRTHVAVLNYTYELPFWRNPKNALQRVLGGWQLNGITAFQSGMPMNIGITGPTVGLAGRPDREAGVSLEGAKTREQWFNTAAFRAPAFGFYGNAGRNLVRGPGIHKWDLSMFKNFLLAETTNLQLRWETFNTFNRVNFSGVATAFGAGNFGQVVSARDARVMQLGIKLEF
jgi:hypothetical protein